MMLRPVVLDRHTRLPLSFFCTPRAHTHTHTHTPPYRTTAAASLTRSLTRYTRRTPPSINVQERNPENPVVYFTIAATGGEQNTKVCELKLETLDAINFRSIHDDSSPRSRRPQQHARKETKCYLYRHA